jgi:hypothetical protein
MKTSIVFFFALMINVVPQVPDSSPLSPDVQPSTVLGVFAGTSLCGEVEKPFLKIPGDASCDRIQWKLTLYHNPENRSATVFKLAIEYGYHVDNRTYKTLDQNVIEGKWKTTKGTKADPEAVVYTLEADNSRVLSFVRMDENIIHLLNTDKSFMVGNGAQSYTLNRIRN